ncbi:lactate/malate family dehydrogenase [Burkholderia ambifaria]|uniref:lactate/malate family dehydrogenase n=1 Tax=Burkholderia ambifaria TaxID=152480 RepID=UPI001592018F|nr:malate dehydrogenase [Burkholderia ambifaria]
MSNVVKRIAVTHAAGPVGRSLVRAIARGELLGPERPVALVLLDDAVRSRRLRALASELNVYAVPAVVSTEIAIDPHTAFRDVHYAIVLDASNAAADELRGRRLSTDAPLLRAYGRALNAVAQRDVKITVAGDAANMRAWVLRCFTPDLPDDAITATIRDDHDSVLAELAALCDVAPGSIEGMIVWGKPRGALYPDIRYARIGRRPVQALLAARHYDPAIVHAHLTRSATAQREPDLAAARDARAVLMHLRDWIDGTSGAWVSMIVPSDGSYGIPKGLMFSVPVVCVNGTYERVRALELDGFARRRIREGVESLRADALAFRHEYLYRGPMIS